MKRDELLDEFRVIAAATLSGPLDAATQALLAKLVIAVPDGALDMKTPLLERNTIHILGDIDQEIADDTVEDLLQIHLNRPIDKPVELIISSEGGDVSGGMAIGSTISQIRREGREVRGHVAGVAHSIAFDILQLCDHRSAEPTAFLMLHEEQFATEGSTSANLVEVQYSKRQIAAYIKAVLCERTGKTLDYYQKKINGKNWYMSADEALADGLLDEIVAIPRFKPVVVAPRPTRHRRTRSSAPAE